MSTENIKKIMFLGSKLRPVRGADNLIKHDGKREAREISFWTLSQHINGYGGH
jgi:hypothetical protein